MEYEESEKVQKVTNHVIVYNGIAAKNALKALLRCDAMQLALHLYSASCKHDSHAMQAMAEL